MTDEIVDRIFAAAKASRRTLTHDQVQKLAADPHDVAIKSR